ncbi:zinc ABC transporter substrate-binding protein [Brachyspira hyodysenteriae]|uniref:metal ABC transporter substrate-binding protein n=1 Tax=Brachyspira hyodysenteriae TaxID=159 RepID=UPI00063DD808|nr:zinc ABC transporter substrate-binding protein [Brachyspira hyodysenteriae]KLI14655.1 ABC transporter substrate-binding protein [Brachyspira hyodysenteriae]MCZ9838803.1 zinc ABC transporter substrate-binding protein [Brachyspira hyodysenteriae]MCZ9848092.1 zinc ABC transporter substrate-binding protein [Brachyspira hyodysenteriae]MCZ9851861.1 zinc ABC transporter substrate-binding protein [Brachyspira hyodysenteriae]MCZ9859401.1 zinc ABC transporter substrate-binding protein [Brachyspira hy
MKKILTIIFILSLLIGCSNSSVNNQNQDSSNKLKVYASIYPMYDFAKKICGDKADVYNMTSTGSEPHDFEITSKDMANLTKANLFIYNGGGMEHWVDTVKDSIKELKYVETAFNINNDGLDPHFWLSPIKAKKQMENIKNALIEIDSVNADYYNSNYNFYADRLDELDNHFKDVLSNMKSTNLVVTHPAFGHFCEEYSLNQVAIARDEADPKAMSDTIAFIKNNNVKAIFYEDFSSSKLVDSIAKETGVKILTLNPIESLSEEYINAGEDYFSVMEENLISLTNGLN